MDDADGYALCTEAGLAGINRMLQSSDEIARDALRVLLRMGLHWNVQVALSQAKDVFVSQAFCSALPISYTGIPAACWTAFARLVLEGAYEATLWAAVINVERFSSNVLFLTEVGGGAFGNDMQWSHDAMRRALEVPIGVGLDVRLVSHEGRARNSNDSPRSSSEAYSATLHSRIHQWARAMSIFVAYPVSVPQVGEGTGFLGQPYSDSVAG